MHPVTGLLRRADAAASELIELIELLQFDLELQCRAVAVQVGQRYQEPRVKAVAAGGLDLAANEIDRALPIYRPHVISKPCQIHWTLLRTGSCRPPVLGPTASLREHPPFRSAACGGGPSDHMPILQKCRRQR